MTTESPDDIVGHKTFRDGDGLRHEPLTRAEADVIRESIDKATAARAEKYPTAEDAVRGLWDAWYRLKELGWQDATYAPPDGREKRTVSIGTTGIHDAACTPRTDREGEKWWWHHDDTDTWPHKPILYLPDEIEREEQRVRGEKFRAAFADRKTRTV